VIPDRLPFPASLGPRGVAVAGEQSGFARGVQARGRLVQDGEQRAVSHQPARQGQPLPLPSGQRPATYVGAEQGVESVRQVTVAVTVRPHQV